MKKFKKIKLRVPRIPENAKIMSLMAIILICAAPALVSIIDDSDTQVMHTADGFKFVDRGTDNLFVQNWESETPENLIKTYTTSEIGSFIFSFDSSAASDYVRVYEIRNLDFDEGLTKIDISVSEPISSIRLKVDNIMFYVFEGVSDTDFSLDVDQIAALNLTSGDSVSILIYTLAEYDYGPGIIVDATTYYGTTIPYGEIIVGATGALLLICALFATPYFGLNGGYTGPKSKRRGV